MRWAQGAKGPSPSGNGPASPPLPSHQRTRTLPAPPSAALGAQRYKLFVQVTLAEARGQGVRVASRMLWDPTSDVMASETYSCDLPSKDGDVVSIVASATVHAVYMP